MCEDCIRQTPNFPPLMCHHYLRTHWWRGGGRSWRSGRTAGRPRSSGRTPARPRVLQPHAGWATVATRGHGPLVAPNPPNRRMGGSRSFHSVGGRRGQTLRRPPHTASVGLLMSAVV